MVTSTRWDRSRRQAAGILLGHSLTRSIARSSWLAGPDEALFDAGLGAKGGEGR
ncbi:hypothetical protein [Methylobacter marinus]|uniref:hypothetical protein n=1 Tax=Methylobacter marinus TaxID=34058 RepID=UPI0003A99BF8|nr:hypothetical protein [Methylobacter marinus]